MQRLLPKSQGFGVVTRATRTTTLLPSTSTCWSTRPRTIVTKSAPRALHFGFTPRDVKWYKCAECGDKGHMKFDRSVLKNYKREDRHVALVCSDCVDRHRKVESTLRRKESIRCTCKGREHNASNDKCGLFPRYAGERRWPGSNMDVSFDDFHFCERMRKRKRT